MNVIFLGTGAGIPAKHRNVSSLALQLMNKNGDIWLFDCGEGTQQQILHTSIKPRKIEKIFITHLHGDHIYGLPGLISTRSFQGACSPLTIYGPKGISTFVETTLEVSGTHLNYPLMLHEITDEGVLFEDEEYIVTASSLVHGIQSYGFRLEQKDLPGSLLVDELKKEGIPPGPIYKEIKEGKLITLPDGRKVDGKKYIGPPKKGVIIAILGDTRYTENAASLAKGANLLIHEATFSKLDEKNAYEYYHCTTTQAAKVAKEANVDQLILNHISSRYQNNETERLLAEAKEIFLNTIIAEDFAVYTVPKTL